MFDSLSARLQSVFGGLRSKGRLSEDDITLALREIRMALLEADVNYRVVKDFVAATKTKALSAEILQSLTPAQNVVAIVAQELTELLGSQPVLMQFSQRIPNVIMLVGLQGSGKTTAAAKLAYRLQKQKHRPLLVAADVWRPAAADQLETLGKEIGVPVFRGQGDDPALIARQSVQAAIDDLRDVVIIDTAGRLHIDEEMMAEARAIRAAVAPENILMVVDSMTGQDVVTVVEAFGNELDFNGVIISKLDGDARGGGALSVRAVTGKPILFVSEGEKPSSLQEFYPERMAKRILGMGDMLSLIEKAQLEAEEDLAAGEAERLARAELNFDDFITINRQVRKLGGIGTLLKALPGGESALRGAQVDEGALDRMEAIINSMTQAERLKPALLNGSRRARIAAGAGVPTQAVNQLVKQYEQTKKMLKHLGIEAEQTRSRKNRRGKKARRRTSRHPTLPGLGSLGRGDMKKLEDMLANQ
ncbi:MAG: signal recognition particle protein [Coriobacteriales bacterium]|jgi:signal recognition particle subunit SRP54|nr:signal recognition particle protein [Coriobacteriales bacterium]